jgi:hypothetical protein
MSDCIESTMLESIVQFYLESYSLSFSISIRAILMRAQTSVPFNFRRYSARARDQWERSGAALGVVSDRVSLQ